MIVQQQEQLVKLHKLLEEHLDQEELRTLCFELWVEYDDLPAAGKSAKARELIGYLSHRRRIPELVRWMQKNRHELFGDYLREFESDTPFIDFVNRGAELDRIFLSTLPIQYWVIDAPAGYGKTDFLRELERRYNELNWVTGYVTISRDASPNIQTLVRHLFAAIDALNQYDQQQDARTIGLQFAACLLCSNTARRVTFGGVTIFIDNIDVLSELSFEKLVEFIIGVYEGLSPSGFFLQQNRVRFFLAGRDARRKVARISKLPFTELTLSPYEFSYVQETVRRYARKVNVLLQEPYIANVAACLMYLSGGHPGCIAGILGELAEGRFAKVGLILQAQPQSLLNRVDSILKDLFVEYDPDVLNLVPLIETLSVFRRFRTWLFEELVEKGYLEWKGDRYELQQALLSTFLLRRERSFLQDSITQRLCAIRLRLNNPQKFEQLCREGVRIYKEKLSCSRNPEQLAVEYVYLRLQHAYYVDKICGESLREVLASILQETITILVQAWEGDRSIVDDFIELCKQDWDLEFLVNYFLGVAFFAGPCSYNHDLYKQIMSSVMCNFTDGLIKEQ